VRPGVRGGSAAGPGDALSGEAPSSPVPSSSVLDRMPR